MKHAATLALCLTMLAVALPGAADVERIVLMENFTNGY